MFTKTRRTIALAAGAVAVAAAAAPAGAVALTKPVGTSPAPVRVLGSSTVSALQAGSAGQKGYSDAKCEQMLAGVEAATNNAEQYLLEGKSKAAAYEGNRATSLMSNLESHCLVVY